MSDLKESYNESDPKDGNTEFDIEDENAEIDMFNSAIDGLESLILAHACAGVDVETAEYVAGVETAIQSIGNNC